MNNEQIKELKLQGFLPQKQNGFFAVRIISTAGNMTSEQMIAISKIADKYGRGYMGFTTRLCVEIPWIKEEDIEKIKEEFKNSHLQTGGTGKKVRPVVACKGTVCVHGIVDTQDICSKIKENFFAKEILPAKFKIGIVGCPNNCGKASLNDLGFMGQASVTVDLNKCVGCGKCMTVCKSNALQKEDKKIKLNKTNCLNCGKCADICPFGAMEVEKKGIGVFLGGKFGRQYRIGNRLDNIYSEDQALKITEKVINYFKNNANQGERFSNMIERLGWAKVKDEILK